jgi:hypothetical protein
MLNKTMSALALALALTSFGAQAASITDSNMKVGFVEAEGTTLYGISGEYVAGNNFFIGGGYADVDGDYGINADLLNVNMGTYFPISSVYVYGGEFYGKVKMSYTDIDTNWYDYSSIGTSASLNFQNPDMRASLGVAAEFSDVYNGFGYNAYNIEAAIGARFHDAWEAGVTGTTGDVDSYGVYVRYDFL